MKKNLDELQLLKRGNIFKHCFFTLLILMFVNLSLLKLEIKILSPENTMILFMQVSVTLFCVKMILNDIYPISENRMRTLYAVYGLLGIAFAIITVIDVFIKGDPIIENQMLSDAGVGLVMAILSLTIVVAYIIKKLNNRNIELEE